MQDSHAFARLKLPWLSAGLLEKLKGLAAVVERKLGDSLTVPVYGTHVASLKAVKETVKERTLHAGVLRSKQCCIENSPVGSAWLGSFHASLQAVNLQHTNTSILSYAFILSYYNLS